MHLNALFIMLEIKSSCSGGKIEKHFGGVFPAVEDVENHHYRPQDDDRQICLFGNY